MNETIDPDNSANVPWLTSDQRQRVRGTSILPDSERAAPAALGLLNNAVQSAHDTIERIADTATPAVQQLGDRFSAAEDALREKTDQLRETRDEWVESARTTVRDNPLVAVAAALTLGAVIARITR